MTTIKVIRGPFSDKDVELPRDQMFAELRERWLTADAEEERTSAQLARLLDVKPQQITNWVSQGAPWWGICRMLKELDLELVIGAQRVYTIEREVKAKAS